MTAVVADLLAVERSQLGVKESPSGSNRTKYGVEYGLNGQPWCAIFQWWCFKKVGIDLKRYSDNPAYTVELAKDLAASPDWEVIAVERQAQPGDLAFMGFRGGRAGIEHVGLVENNRYPNFTTIDGNTGAGSQVNGGAVQERNRTDEQILKLLRYRKWGAASTVPSIPSQNLPQEDDPVKIYQLRYSNRVENWLGYADGHATNLTGPSDYSVLSTMFQTVVVNGDIACNFFKNYTRERPYGSQW